MSHYFSNNINSFNTIYVSNNYTVADEQSEILTWLSPLEPHIRHQDVRTSRVDNVGHWLLQTEEFQSWCDINRQDKPDNAALFCHGDPGVGKTHISSLVIDALCDQANGGGDFVVACFYFDFAVHKEQSPINVLGALLKQVVRGLGDIPEEIVQAFERQKRVIGGRGLRLSEIVRMLQNILSSRRTYVCIDALDECVPHLRLVLLDSLRKILDKSRGTRLFLTGRPHIQDEVEKYLCGRTSVVSIKPSIDDIIRYILSRLSMDTTPDAMDDSLEADILKSVPNRVSEIFLLVSLNIEAILQETTIHRRRQKLRAVSDGLGLEDAYGATLRRIKAQGGEKAGLGIAALMWTCYSERPLQEDELCHALAVEIGSPEFHAENVPSIQTLLSCCQGLIVVDKEASRIRLIHSTLQEYLFTHRDLFGRAHLVISETCLTYLNSQEVKHISANPVPDSESAPFLAYSSLYWGTHAKLELSDYAKSLALKLLSRYENHASSKLLLQHALDPYDFNDIRSGTSPFAFTGLHCASFFGVVEVATALMRTKGCDINQIDCTGVTPLMWAAENGHDPLVKLLLAQSNLDPDMVDPKYGRTALSRAAGNGHEGVVKLLLGLESEDSWWRHSPRLMRLMQGWSNAKPNIPDYHNRTPLSWAAGNGHLGVVTILLGEEGVGPDKPDQLGQTPLLWAARNGHEGIVQLLLEREDIAPDTPDQLGQTPLSWSTEMGNSDVVKLLLQRPDVNLNKPDHIGRSPLSHSAEMGNQEIVSLFLRRADLTPDTPDKWGQTPLLRAVRNGHERVVELLLKREDIDYERADAYGQTLIELAQRNNHAKVMELLRRRKSAVTRRDLRVGAGQGLGCTRAGELEWAGMSAFLGGAKPATGNSALDSELDEVL